MNDREFIELLNLYVDREISPEDALRLEAEVAGDAGRRRVYDQYCRMQKACSMLSAQAPGAAADEAGRHVIEFPAPRAWRFGPIAAGVAAAACVILVFGLRERVALATHHSPGTAVTADGKRSIPDTMDLSHEADPMSPVYFARVPAADAGGSVPRPLFAMADEASQPAPLTWIGDIHMAPVFSASSPNFLLSPKADLKAAISDESQNGRYLPEAAEMTAFRFQR